jgi:hypothetical protein
MTNAEFIRFAEQIHEKYRGVPAVEMLVIWEELQKTPPESADITSDVTTKGSP